MAILMITSSINYAILTAYYTLEYFLLSLMDVNFGRSNCFHVTHFQNQLMSLTRYQDERVYSDDEDVRVKFPPCRLALVFRS